MNKRQRKRRTKQKKETVKVLRAQTAALYAESANRIIEEHSYNLGYEDGQDDKEESLPYSRGRQRAYASNEEAYDKGYADGYNANHYNMWPAIIILVLITSLVGSCFLL